MTKIDNSKIFLDGVFGDATVTVPAKTTYEEGTVLGLNSNDEIVAYTTANDNASFTGEPSYILAQKIVNDTNAATINPLARVFECGSANKDKVIFVKAADANDISVIVKAKNNGLKLVNVQELTA